MVNMADDLTLILQLRMIDACRLFLYGHYKLPSFIKKKKKNVYGTNCQIESGEYVDW